MKNEMNEIPTPETDAVDAKQGSKTRAYSYLNMRDHAIDLERRLTVAREAMQDALTASFRGQTGRAHNILDEALTQTAPKL